MMGSANHSALVVVLRVVGVVELLALVAVVMPRAWMAASHSWLGLGTLPEAPIVGYLARSTSLLYAIHGTILFFVSFDIARYWRLITLIASLAMIQGAFMLGIDLAEGMPVWWVVSDSLGVILSGAVPLALQWISGPPVSTEC
jgi:hypothetical protein